MVLGTPPTTLKPPAVPGFVLRRVFDRAALIEGRDSMIEVEPGMVAPGLGRVEAIKREDGRWVVVTARGIVARQISSDASAVAECRDGIRIKSRNDPVNVSIWKRRSVEIVVERFSRTPRVFRRLARNKSKPHSGGGRPLPCHRHRRGARHDRIATLEDAITGRWLDAAIHRDAAE